MNADSRMASALGIVEATRLNAGMYEDEINRSIITLTGAAGDIDADSMIALARDRHAIQIKVSRDGWSGILRSQDSAVFAVEQDPPDGAFEETEVIDALLAQAGIADVTQYLALVPDLAAEVRIELTNFPATSNYEWYRSTSTLEENLASTAWLAYASMLCEPDGRRRVVVHDARSSQVRAAGLIIQGPDIELIAPAPSESDSVAKFRADHLQGDFAAIPSPLDVAPTSADGFKNVASLLNGIAEQLSWVWLARKAWWSDGKIQVRYDGVRVVEGSLSVEPLDSATDALALWKWATATADPARFEAILRSISFVTVEPDELRGAGTRILTSAESVLDVMTRTQVAEVMAARNSARDAAFAAARSAAAEARSAASSTFDRVVVQAAAVAGLLLANEQHALGGATTKVLLLVIVALLVVLGIVVFVIDFPGARAGLAAFQRDLDLYRDHLTKTDVEVMKKMQSLRDASAAITRAQLLTLGLLAAGIGADLYAYFRVK